MLALLKDLPWRDVSGAIDLKAFSREEVSLCQEPILQIPKTQNGPTGLDAVCEGREVSHVRVSHVEAFETGELRQGDQIANGLIPFDAQVAELGKSLGNRPRTFFSNGVSTDRQRRELRAAIGDRSRSCCDDLIRLDLK